MWLIWLVVTRQMIGHLVVTGQIIGHLVVVVVEDQWVVVVMDLSSVSSLAWDPDAGPNRADSFLLQLQLLLIHIDISLHMGIPVLNPLVRPLLYLLHHLPAPVQTWVVNPWCLPVKLVATLYCEDGDPGYSPFTTHVHAHWSLWHVQDLDCFLDGLVQSLGLNLVYQVDDLGLAAPVLQDGVLYQGGARSAVLHI